jgi:AmmeMemoRadiSam system protein B
MVDARKPAAAGVFYPADSERLAPLVRELLDGAKGAKHPPGRQTRVRAIVVPHGLLGVAGTIAAVAWNAVATTSKGISRVLLLGPAHHVPFAGVAAPFADSFATPLGEVPVDRLAIEGVRHLPQIVINDLPHEQEPSLEAQLPMLQICLPQAMIIPLVVGEVTDAEGAQVVEALWDDRTLVVVSTDLSRYFDASTARRLDEGTARAIEGLDAPFIGEQQACGHAALRALLLVARARKLSAVRLGLGHSAGPGADQDEVVGFGAFALG